MCFNFLSASASSFFQYGGGHHLKLLPIEETVLGYWLEEDTRDFVNLKLRDIDIMPIATSFLLMQYMFIKDGVMPLKRRKRTRTRTRARTRRARRRTTTRSRS